MSGCISGLRTAVLALILPICAEAQPERRLQEPSAFSSPVHSVEIHVPTGELVVQPYDSNAGGAAISPVGSEIDEYVYGRRVKKQQAAVAQLGRKFEGLDLFSLAEEAARRELTSLAPFRDAEIRRRGANSQSEIPTSRVLHLTLEHYLTYEFSTLRTRLTASLWTPRGRGEPQLIFFQRYYYDHSAPKQSFGDRDNKHMNYWASVDPDVLRAEVERSVAAVFQLLAFDHVQTMSVASIRKLRGEKRTFIDLPIREAAVEIARRDGRRWIRVFNGFLANVEVPGEAHLRVNSVGLRPGPGSR